VTLGAALFAATPARAASCKKDVDCGSGQTCSKGICVSKAARSAGRTASDAADTVGPTSDINAGTKRSAYIGWAGLGFYDIDGTGAFAIHAGGAVNLLPLTPEMPLIGWADVGMGFASGGTVFPLKLGAGVRYDRAGPVQLLGGAAFTVMPTTVANASTPVGISLMGMVLYPLPQLNPNLSAQAQIGYDILTESASTFELTVGVGWAF
ncbi:MAG TPA: hypothetical protein VI356_07585, partial [Myxococcales bacterium]